jgi:hypothetical protein
MKQESSAFTAADVPRFFGDIAMYDLGRTAARLRAASARMQQLAQRVPDERSSGGEWTAKEILAHIAVVSRAYGVFAYLAAKGRLPELEMGAVISQRDVVGEKMAQQSVTEIVAEAVRQHQRTLKFMDAMTLDDALKTVQTESGSITVEHLLRIPLVAHTEQHLEQLEAALDGASPAG